MKKKIKAIILDFDGVVVESVDIKTEAFGELFSRYTADVEPIKKYHLDNNGVSRFIKFRHIWEKMLNKKYSDEVAEKLGGEFSGIVLQKVVGCPFVTGAVNFLEEMHKKFPVYVASAVPEKELEEIITRKNICKYFTRAYGYPPVTKSEAIRDVMARESALPGEILYVGDSNEDLKAAHGAGVIFVARKNRETFRDSSVPLCDDMNGVMKYVLEKIDV